LDEGPDLRGTSESNMIIISGTGLMRRAKRLTERDRLSGNRRVFNIEGVLVSCGLAMINVITVALNHIAINQDYSVVAKYRKYLPHLSAAVA
jgi:hypothetical protein